jgi:hypothetical protein
VVGYSERVLVAVVVVVSGPVAMKDADDKVDFEHMDDGDCLHQLLMRWADPSKAVNPVDIAEDNVHLVVDRGLWVLVVVFEVEEVGVVDVARHV